MKQHINRSILVIWIGMLVMYMLMDGVHAQSTANSVTTASSVSPWSIVNPVTTDVSLLLIQQVFGALPGFSGSSGETNQIIQQLLIILNIGLISFMGGFVAYSIFSGVIVGGTQGNMMGQNFSFFSILRPITGVLLVAPDNTGLCMLQKFMLWCIVQGVGVADNIWINALDFFHQNQDQVYSVPAQKQYSDLNTLVENSSGSSSENVVYKIFKSIICTRALYHDALASELEQADDDRSTRVSPNNFGYSILSDKATGIISIKFGQLSVNPGSNSNVTERQDVCGSYTVSSAGFNATQQVIDNLGPRLREYFDTVYDAHKNGNAIPNELKLYCTDSSFPASWCAPGLMMTSAASDFYSLIKAQRLKPPSTTVNTDWITSAKATGWITAGQYYWNLNTKTTSRQTLSKLADFTPTSTQPTFSIRSRDLALKSAYQDFHNTYYDQYSAKAVQIISKIEESMDATLLCSPKEGATCAQDAVLSGEPSSLDIVTARLSSMMFAPYPPPWGNPVLSYGIRTDISRVNMLTSIRMVIESLVGIKMFTSAPMNEDAYRNAIRHVNNSCKHYAEKVCWKNGQIIAGCFKLVMDNAVCNYDKDDPIGLLGSIWREQYGGVIEPLRVLASIGQSLIQAAVYYWIVNNKMLFDATLKVTIITTALMTTFYTIGETTAAAGSYIQWQWGFMVIDNLTGAFAEMVTWFKTITDFNLSLFGSFGFMVASLLFTMGILLGLVIPLTPFMMFLFGALGWLIAVFESMVAAPFVALGIAYPEGHDFLGKAQQAGILLLNVILRPIVMVMSLFFALLLSYVVFRMYNFSFIYVVAGYLGDVDEDLSLSFSMLYLIALILTYAYTCLALVGECFAVIVTLPDKIMRWIDSTTLPPDQAQEMVQEVSGAVKSAGDSIARGAGEASDKGTGVRLDKDQLTASIKEGIAEQKEVFQDAAEQKEKLKKMYDMVKDPDSEEFKKLQKTGKELGEKLLGSKADRPRGAEGVPEGSGPRGRPPPAGPPGPDGSGSNTSSV